MTTVSLLDEAEVRRTLDLLLPAGQVTELRALNATVNGDKWPATYTGFFDNGDKLVAELGKVRSATGVYLTPNPIKTALLARAANRLKRAGKGDSTSDRDIESQEWLLVDCDAIRPAGVSASNKEHAAAKKKARLIADELKYNYGWPAPIVADSGNGAHLMFRVASGELVEPCLRALAWKFSDDEVKVDTAVHNPARIWKLYGTLACKGDSTADRPHRMSRILSAPSQMGVVSEAHMAELASEAAEPAAEPRQQSRTTDNTFDIEGFIRRHSLDVSGPDPYQGGKRWTFTRSPLCDHHGDGPFLIQFANGALAAGCHHESCAWGWRELREQLEPRANPGKGMPDWRPDDDRDGPKAQPRLITLGDVMPSETNWLWDGYFPLGSIVDVSGDPGLGKSQTLMDIAARITIGSAHPPAFSFGGPYEPRDVLLLSAEDDPARTIRPRADAAGADVSRIHLLRAMAASEGDDGERLVCLPLDVDAIEDIVIEKQVALVVIDPFEAHLADGLNPNANVDMRRCLTPLSRMAERTGCVVVLVRHLNKKPGASALYRGGGSIGIIGAARAGFIVGSDPDDPDTRIFACVKSNLGPEPPSLAFTIEPVGTTSRVAWTGESDHGASDIIGGEGRSGGKLEVAIRILREKLANGPRGENEVRDACEKAGVSFSTYKRARREMGITAERIGFGKSGEWMLSLPDTIGVQAP